MDDPVSTLRERLDRVSQILDRIKISMTTLDGHRLGEIDEDEAEYMAQELEMNFSNLEHTEWILDHLDRMIEAGPGEEIELLHEGVECAHCGSVIEEESRGTGSPVGSMHRQCAYKSEQEDPAMW